MLVKSNRFHGHSSLNWVYAQGKTVRDPLVSLKFALNSRRSSFRAAVVISRKVHKSSVKRNRIRRRVYEVIRQLSPSINGAYDLVFNIYSVQIGELKKTELEKLIKSLLTQANVISD